MTEAELNQSIEELLTMSLKDAIDKEKPTLNKIIDSIKNLIKDIDDGTYIQIINNDNQLRSQRLLKYLDEKYVSIYKNEDELKNKTDLINKITKLYFLTEQFFAVFGVIVKPHFLMTYDDGEHYIRKDFERLLVENPSEYLRISQDSDGAFGLQFKTGPVIKELEKQIKDDEKAEQIAKDLHKHYITFISPYTRHSKKKGWQMNAGVAREAFERHLERLHKTLPKEFKSSCNMESVGKRWLMYRYSSGSDPYFTGPDTESSQVKAENASLVSNVATVLNTAKYIVKYGESVDAKDLKSLLKTKGEGEIKTFSKELWNSFDKTIQNKILVAFSKDLKSNVNAVKDKGKDYVSVFWKEN